MNSKKSVNTYCSAFSIYSYVNLAFSQFVKSENVKDLKQESTQLDSKATHLEIPECV